MPLTKENLLSLKRVIRNFDHCCWSKEDHLKVLAEINRLQLELEKANRTAEDSLWEIRRLTARIVELEFHLRKVLP